MWQTNRRVIGRGQTACYEGQSQGALSELCLSSLTACSIRGKPLARRTGIPLSPPEVTLLQLVNATIILNTMSVTYYRYRLLSTRTGQVTPKQQRRRHVKRDKQPGKVATHKSGWPGWATKPDLPRSQSGHTRGRAQVGQQSRVCSARIKDACIGISWQLRVAEGRARKMRLRGCPPSHDAQISDKAEMNPCPPLSWRF